MSANDLADVLKARCLAPAVAQSATARAWLLVGLGAALGRIGEGALALRFLDAAVALEPDRQAQAAAYQCAVKLHWEAGDLETPLKVHASSPAR